MMDHLSAAEKTIVTDEVKAKLAKAKELTTPYMDSVRRVYRLAIDDKIDEAKAEYAKFGGTVNEIVNAFNELAKAKEDIGKKCFDEAEATCANARNASIAVTVAALVVGLGFGWFIARMIGKVLGALIGETKRLTDASVAGKLQTRGNPELVGREFRPIVEGINETLDAVVGPLNVTAEYVDRISKGDIPPKITDTYNGDFNEIKNNLNQCIEVMNGLLSRDEYADPGDRRRQACRRAATPSSSPAAGASWSAASTS